MANKVDFTINLKVNGKDQAVQASVAVDDLREAVEQSRSSLENALQSVNNWGFALHGLQDAVNGIASSLNTLTEESRTFGGAMAAANTMAGKSGDDFQNLKEQVTELSKTIPVARDQLANGLYQVISNGVPEDNWIEYLEKSAKASVGGIADLGETVKVTSTVIKNYGLEWDAAGEIQDKIQLTAKNGVTSFEQMAQALPRVTAQAATLGVSVDELMASFATLTGVSGNTAEVSTQLAAIFTALIKPSSEATEMAQQMGIQFDAAAIKAAGGMKNFLTELSQDVTRFAASSGMLEQEIYGKLFGSAESLRALTPLTGQLADKFEENVSAMKGSAGTIDEAFETMASTGSAQLQKLNNKLGEYTDMLQASIGNLLPYINFASQLTVTASSAMQLITILRSLNVVSKATAVVTGTLGPLWEVCSATMRGAAVSATTLKLAIRGLMISTVVGAAVAGLTVVIERLCNATDNAAGSATDMAAAEASAADTVKDAYENTLKSTYANLMTKYEQLRQGWRSLRSEHEKMQWIKNNQSAFEELRIKIDSVADAESIFQRNTEAVVEAFDRRAKAAAYAAKLTELYQKQIALFDKKNKVVEKIANDAKSLGHNAKKDDEIKDQTYWNERFGSVRNDGKWHFTQEGAERYNGTNTTSNSQVVELDKSIKALGKEIDETKKQLKEQSAGDWIRPTKTTNGGTTSGTTATTPKKNATTTTSDAVELEPQKNSIDWYEKQLETLRDQINAAADEGVAKTKQAEYAKLEEQLKGLKIRIGIDEAPKAEIKTKIQKLNEELQKAQNVFNDTDPLDVDAKLNALADIDRIQREIDEATKGKLTIEAETEPAYIVQGSAADKRQSYSNAQTKASRIQQDFEIGLIGKDEALRQVDELNKELESLGAGLKPIKIEVDSKGFAKAMGTIKDAWGGIQGIGSGVESITSALDGDKNAWEAISGVISGFISIAEGVQSIVAVIQLLTTATHAHTAAKAAEAVATGASTTATATDATGKAVDAAATIPVVAANKLATASFLELASASYFAAHAYIPFAGFGIAAGFVTAAVAMTEAVGMMAFATGGIVPGTSRSGDKVAVRVNSGEMILNAAQQARLFAIANGAAVYGEALGVGTEWQNGLKPQEVKAQLATLQRLAIEGQTGTEQSIKLRVRGRDLIQVSGNELRSTRKRSNLR